MKKSILAVAIGFVLVASNPAGASWIEDFEGGMPGDWNTVDYHGSSPFQWTLQTSGGSSGGSGNYAEADSEAAGPPQYGYDVGLVTHSSVVPLGAFLQFDTFYWDSADSDTDFGDVDYTTNGGSTWLSLLNWSVSHQTEHITEPLAIIEGQTARLRFRYYDYTPPIGGNWFWQVDNVWVTPEPASLLLLALGGLVALGRRR